MRKLLAPLLAILFIFSILPYTFAENVTNASDSKSSKVSIDMDTSDVYLTLDETGEFSWKAISMPSPVSYYYIIMDMIYQDGTSQWWSTSYYPGQTEKKDISNANYSLTWQPDGSSLGGGTMTVNLYKKGSANFDISIHFEDGSAYYYDDYDKTFFFKLDVPAEEIVPNQEVYYLEPRDYETFHAKILPSNADCIDFLNYSFHAYTDDKSIAYTDTYYVSDTRSGYVLRAKMVGETTLHFTSSDNRATATAKVVVQIPVKSVNCIYDPEIQMKKTGTIKYSVNPSNATIQELTWESLNPEIVSIKKIGDLDDDGYYPIDIQVNRVGTAILKYTSNDFKRLTGTIAIEVKPINLESLITPDISKTILPSYLNVIEEQAFAGNAFEYVVIPRRCDVISAGAFEGNTSLKFVEIPASVMQIDATAFKNCNEDLVIITTPESYAEAYAIEHSFYYAYK